MLDTSGHRYSEIAEYMGRHNLIVEGDNLSVLGCVPAGSVGLVYTDPPFNTGRKQQRITLKTLRDGVGDRTGFGDRRYKTSPGEARSYEDYFADFQSFLLPRLKLCWQALDPRGSLYVHLDYHEVHYVKVALDGVFGREHFLNEIIWAYDFGGRPKDRWPPKHDTILVYVRNPDAHWFNREKVARIPYMAPGLVGPEKAAKGKFPTDVWWHTIVGTASREKTGYPTQKPIGVVGRILDASAVPGLPVLDPFAGSGTTGAAALARGLSFVMVDSNPQAIKVMRQRLTAADPLYIVERSSG